MRWKVSRTIPGQEDYHLIQHEQGLQATITASDLLRFLAHCDAQTKRYSLAEDDVNMPRDMLGRFTGFLCATLFSHDAKQYTEPLPEVSLQEA